MLIFLLLIRSECEFTKGWGRLGQTNQVGIHQIMVAR